MRNKYLFLFAQDLVIEAEKVLDPPEKPSRSHRANLDDSAPENAPTPPRRKNRSSSFGQPKDNSGFNDRLIWTSKIVNSKIIYLSIFRPNPCELYFKDFDMNQISNLCDTVELNIGVKRFVLRVNDIHWKIEYRFLAWFFIPLTCR